MLLVVELKEGVLAVVIVFVAEEVVVDVEIKMVVVVAMG